MKKKMTITDVAKEMKVSVTTISFILNDKGAERKISPSLIRRVQAYAKRVGYTPNPKAKRQSVSSKLFAVLVDDLLDAQQSQLLYAIDGQLRDSGYRCVVMSMYGHSQEGEEQFRLLEDKAFAGYILMGFAGVERVADRLRSARTPFVLLDQNGVDIDENHVAIDYKSVLIVQMTKTLESYKVERVGLVIDQSADHRAKDYLSGYMEVMDRQGKDLLVKKVQMEQADRQIAEQLLVFVRDNRLDAVVFSTARLTRLGMYEIVTNSLTSVQLCFSSTDGVFNDDRINHVQLFADVQKPAQDVARLLISQVDAKTSLKRR